MASLAAAQLGLVELDALHDDPEQPQQPSPSPCRTHSVPRLRFLLSESWNRGFPEFRLGGCSMSIRAPELPSAVPESVMAHTMHMSSGTK